MQSERKNPSWEKGKDRHHKWCPEPRNAAESLSFMVSKHDWTRHWATYPDWGCSEQELGLETSKGLSQPLHSCAFLNISIPVLPKLEPPTSCESWPWLSHCPVPCFMVTGLSLTQGTSPQVSWVCFVLPSHFLFFACTSLTPLLFYLLVKFR